MPLDPQAVAAAITAADVNANRKVVIDGVEYDPSEVAQLAARLSSLASQADTAIVHRAGDVFISAGGAVFFSDGVNLHNVLTGVDAPIPYWEANGFIPRLAYAKNGRPYGDILREAVRTNG